MVIKVDEKGMALEIDTFKIDESKWIQRGRKVRYYVSMHDELR